jgi:hypothetical protein
MSSIAAEPLEIVPGVQLSLALPEGAREPRASQLPNVDLSAIAGAKVALRVFVEVDGLLLRAVCATAPSDRWAPGVEELVLDRASGLLRIAVGGIVDRWDPEALRVVGFRFEQRFEGAGRQGDTAIAIRGRHMLAFTGSDHAAVLCSVVCTAPVEPLAPRCGALVEAARLEGELVPPPEPSLLVRGMLLAADQPSLAAAAFAATAAACVALLLARRPRRPWPG